MVGDTRILGILNLTPDSFYAASRSTAGEVVSRAMRLLEEGADGVDLGACSPRPGAPQPSLEEEWARLEPALKAWRRYSQGETLPEMSLRAPVRANISGRVSPWLYLLRQAFSAGSSRLHSSSREGYIVFMLT